MKQWIKLTLFSSMLMLAVIFGAACSEKKKVTKPKQHIITAQRQTPVKPLYLTGVIEPLKTVSILSPVEGRIEKVAFQYGETVKKNQLLFVLNSVKLMDNFRQAVSEYLEKKASYLIQLQQMQGYRILYKAGVIARNEYINQENSYQTSVISFFQQEYALQKVLEKANINPQLIEVLTLEDTKKIQTLFASHFNHIKVKATTSGVALFPLPDSSSNQSNDSATNDSSQLTVGNNVHDGQLLLAIGDLSGYSISMMVSEVNINRIHKGMDASITGDAFSGITLHGKIAYVASQAQPSQGSNNSSLGQFKVIVKVKSVNPVLQKIIHVGMTAKVAINIKMQKQIILPIEATFEKNGQQTVTIIDERNQQKDVPVVIGGSTLQGVIIVSGILPGQKVVVRD